MINDTLDAVNLILRKLGEPPIGSLDTQYPTLDLVLPALEEARVGLLSEGWWFNTFDPTTLSPNPQGIVPVPPDTLAFYPTDPKYIYAGTFMRLRDGTIEIGESIEGRRVVDIEFQHLPQVVRHCIAYYACMHVYAADVGLDDIWQGIQGEYIAAYREVSGMHTRQRQLNSRTKRQYQRWKRMLYT